MAVAMNCIKNGWEFILFGNFSLLKQISSSRLGYDFQVREVFNDLIDASVDDLRFCTWHCNGVEDRQVALEKGFELVSLFNGAASLFYESTEKTQIYSLWLNQIEQKMDENSQLFVPLAVSENGNDCLKEHEENCKGDIITHSIHVASLDPGIYLLLKYFDLELNWLTLYKILESLEELAKQDSFNLGVASQKRGAFTNTANSYSLSGIESRHGFKVKKQNKSAVMTIQEARSFIRELTKKYFQEKLR